MKISVRFKVYCTVSAALERVKLIYKYQAFGSKHARPLDSGQVRGCEPLLLQALFIQPTPVVVVVVVVAVVVAVVVGVGRRCGV